MLFRSDELTIQITNVADTTENLIFDGTTIALTNGVAGTTTGGQSIPYSVAVSSNTATISFDGNLGIAFTAAELVTALNAATYTNTDQSPTTGSRVITITHLADEGSAVSPNDRSADSGLAQATTITIAAAQDLPTTGDQTKTILEDATYTAASGDFTFADVDGDSITKIQITTVESAGDLEYDGNDVSANLEIAIGNIGLLTFDPADNAFGATYATFQFKVHDGTAYSTNAYVLTTTLSAVKDRKSTRLNSSHKPTSYAVFCLKKQTSYHNHPH